MFEEKIKIAAEAAVRGPAKLSGIFPQPEAGLFRIPDTSMFF